MAPSTTPLFYEHCISSVDLLIHLRYLRQFDASARYGSSGKSCLVQALLSLLPGRTARAVLHSFEGRPCKLHSRSLVTSLDFWRYASSCTRRIKSRARDRTLSRKARGKWLRISGNVYHVSKYNMSLFGEVPMSAFSK